MYTITHFLVDSSLLLRSLCYKILSRCNTQQHIAQTEVLLHLKGSTAWKKWARPPDGCRHINHACMNTFESTAESNWGFLTTLFSSSDIVIEVCCLNNATSFAKYFLVSHWMQQIYISKLKGYFEGIVLNTRIMNAPQNGLWLV